MSTRLKEGREGILSFSSSDQEKPQWCPTTAGILGRGMSVDSVSPVSLLDQRH